MALVRTMKYKSGTSWKSAELNLRWKRSDMPASKWTWTHSQRKRRVTVQTVSSQTPTKRNLRNLSQCPPRCRTCPISTQSANADSAGSLKHQKKIHFLELASVLALSVKFIMAAFQLGYKLVSSLRRHRISQLSSGRPSSVKSASKPTLLWWRQKAEFTILWSTISLRETIWSSRVSVKRRTLQESSTLFVHQLTRQCSSWAVAMKATCASMTSLLAAATRKSNLRGASSFWKITRANLEPLSSSSREPLSCPGITKLCRSAARSSTSLSSTCRSLTPQPPTWVR